MASSREMQQSSRPLTHRPSLSGSSTTTLPARSSHTRANSHSSHSLLTSSLNPNHRVTRRKSVTNSAANVNALVAVLRDSERSSALPIAGAASRRHTVTKTTSCLSGLVGSLPSPPPSFPNKTVVKQENGSSAIDDNQDTSGDEGSDKLGQGRIRRASDGQPLTKEGKKSNRAELRCEQCGKGYKHSSCLTKHLWEHTPEWSYTSKLLISKHQQVQLLEAASVLVTMNDVEKDNAVATPPDSTRDSPSDQDSEASPVGSGYSEPSDRLSSAETTPPPSEGLLLNGMSYRNKRHSSIGGFSRSYQSAPFVGSHDHGGRYGHARHLSGDIRPTSSGINTTGQEDRDLAAAVELLSCSFGSNNGSRSKPGTVTLPADAPPVPPVPSQYLGQASSLTPVSFINSFPRRQPESFTRGEFRRDSVEVKSDGPMDSIMDDDDYDAHSRARSDDDDDGVFGRMEE